MIWGIYKETRPQGGSCLKIIRCQRGRLISTSSMATVVRVSMRMSIRLSMCVSMRMRYVSLALMRCSMLLLMRTFNGFDPPF
jgi:hypothetical protein